MGFENVGKILREGTSQTAKTTKKKKQTTGLQPLTDISQKQSSQNPSKTTSTKSQNATKKANTFKVPESRKAAETPQVQTVLEKAHPEIKSGIMPVQPKKYDAAYFDRKAHQPGQSEARKYDKAVAQYLPYLDTLKKNVDYYSQNKTVQFKLDNGSIKTGAELAQEAQTEYNRVNSATAEYREIRDYYKGLVFDKPRKATLKDYTINSFKRGWNTNEYGKESANAMFGAKNSKKYYENLLKGDDYNFKPQGLLGEGISGAVEFLGQNANRLLNPNAWAAALGAGGAASVAGKAGPQALLPEEVITVPAAAAFGFKASSTYDMFKTEAGLAYNEMIGNGATPKTARNIATVVGVVNAALEMMQLDDLVKSFKILKDIDATKPLAKKIASYVLKRGANVASETAQEMAQETVTIAGANLASKMDKGKWENDWQEAAQRVLETGKSSALSFAITGATGDIANYGVNKTAETVNKTIIQPNKIGSQIVNKGGAIGAIDEGLGFGLNTDAYKNAQKLSQKIVDNKNVSNYSIGKQAILNSEQNIETLKRNVADDLKTYGLADIKGLTEAMTNLLTGEKISGNQAEIIARSKDAVRLLEIYTLEDIDTDRGISQIKEAIKNLDTSQLMPSLFEISPQQRISDFAETLGNSGKNTLTKFYNGAQNAEDYVREMNAVYQAGRNNTEIPLTDTINSAQAQAMYQAGQVDTGKVSGYNVNNQNNNVKGVENYASTRGQNNRQSGKRYDSSNTEGQVRQVAQGTGRNVENRSNEVRQGGSGQANANAQKVKGKIVTAESLGIKGGDNRNNVTLVTGNYEGRAEVERIAREQGLKVVAFSGDNLSMTESAEEFTARGAIQGDTMYVRTDDPDVTPAQIAEHEATHDKIKKGQINLARVKERSYDVSKGGIEKLTQVYANAFYGIEIGDEIPEEIAKTIFEEIVCDSVAGMNFYEYSWGQYDESTGVLNHMISDYAWQSEREISKAKETRGSPIEMGTKFAKNIDANKKFQGIFNGFVSDSTYALTYRQKEGIRKAIMDGDADISPTMKYGKVILYDNEYLFRIIENNSVDVYDFTNNEELNIHEERIEENNGTIYRTGQTTDNRTWENADGKRNSENRRNNYIANGKKIGTEKTTDRLDEQKSTGRGKRDISEGIRDKSDRQVKTSRVVQTHEEVRAENRALREEISRLKAKVKAKTEQAEYWKGETQLTKSAPTVNQKDIKAVTSHYFKDLGMKHISHKSIQDSLTDIAEYILRGDEDTGVPEYDTIKQKALDLADTMIENCEEIDTEKEEQYKRLKEYFKTVTIKVSNKGDIADYNSFRKSLLGKMNLSLEDGMPIDTIWAELGEMFGKNYFPNEITNPTDQLLQAVDVLNDLSDILHNPFEQHMEDARQDLSNDIIEHLLDETVRQKQTAADKLYKKYNERNIRLKTLLSDVRKRRDERISAIQENYKTYREKVSDKNLSAQLLKIGRRLENKKLPAPNRAVMQQWDAEINKFIGEFDFSVVKVTPERQAKMSEIAERVAQLENEYPEYNIDPNFRKYLDGVGRKHISDLTKQEKIDLINNLLQLEHEIDNANRFLGFEERQSVKGAGLKTLRDIQNAEGEHKNDFLAMVDFGLLRPESLVKKIVGYNLESPLYKATKNLQAGETKMLEYGIRAADMFRQFFGKDAAPQYKDFEKKISGKNAEHIPVIGTVYTGTDENGNAIGKKMKVDITPAMRMSIFMNSLNAQNMAHMVEGGLQIPDINSKAYKDGKVHNAPSERVVLSLQEIRRITVGMTIEERAFCYAMQKYFEMSSKDINDVSLKLFGVDKATVENYFPIYVVKDFNFEDLGAMQADGTVVGMGGRLNERVNSDKPIWLFDANDILKQSVLLHSRFVGLSIPFRDMNKLWNVQETGIKDAAIPSALNKDKKSVAYITNIKEAVRKKWTNKAEYYITDFIKAFNNGADRSSWDTIFSNYQNARIAYNLGVALKQAASYQTAIAEVGWKPVLRAMFMPVNKELLQQSARYRYRTGAYDIIQKQGMDVIQAVDTFTVAHLLPAAEFYVQENFSDLKTGSDEYNQKVLEVFDDIITRTQPNYTPLERPGFLRSKHIGTRTLNIFKTQPYQNLNILYDALGEYYAAEKAYDYQMKGKDKIAQAEAKAKYDTAKTRLAWGISSQIASSFIYAAMQAAVDGLKRKKRPKVVKKYKDKDGNVTILSVLKGIGINMLTNVGGFVPLGSEFVNTIEYLADHIRKRLDKDPIFYAYLFDINLPVFDIINNLFSNSKDALGQTIDLAFDVAEGEQPKWDKIGKKYYDLLVSAVELKSGMPIKNLTDTADTIISWLKPQEKKK